MRVRLALCVLAILAFVCPAAAEDCNLKLAVSVETERSDNGMMLVPVMLAGQRKLFLLDTGGFFSELSIQAISELGLSSREVRLMQRDVSGKTSNEIVAVEDVSLGTMKIGRMQFMRSTHNFGGDVAGILSPNVFTAYDLDLDFPNNKMQLMLQDHCPGKVIYWPHDAVAMIPMRVDSNLHVVFPMEIDGRRVKALLDTGATQTTLNMRIARLAFGLNENSPDVEPVGRLKEGAGSQIYRYRFKSLSAEGITVHNPVLHLMPDLMRNYTFRAPALGSRLGDPDKPQGLPELILGMSVLRHLHVYIAYKEKMIYLTAGGGTTQGTASSEPPPAQ